MLNVCNFKCENSNVKISKNCLYMSYIGGGIGSIFYKGSGVYKGTRKY